jgi:hypothetical protein
MRGIHCQLSLPYYMLSISKIDQKISCCFFKSIFYPYHLESFTWFCCLCIHKFIEYFHYILTRISCCFAPQKIINIQTKVLSYIFATILILQSLQQLSQTLNNSLISWRRYDPSKYKLLRYFLLWFNEINKFIQLIYIRYLVYECFRPFYKDSSHCLCLIITCIFTLQSFYLTVKFRWLFTYQFYHITLEISIANVIIWIKDTIWSTTCSIRLTTTIFRSRKWSTTHF